ncbi:MAG: sugar-binding domain-containing protein, partial [Blastocatellia bacterium]
MSGLTKDGDSKTNIAGRETSTADLPSSARLPAAAAGNVRERLLFDDDWRFALGNGCDAQMDFSYGTGQGFAKAGDAAGPFSPKFDDREWRKLNLPHDWVVELPFEKSTEFSLDSHGYKPIGVNYPENSIGWYRKTFEIPAADEGKRIAMVFDGVFRDSQVWVNGHLLARNLSGYIGFRCDLTDYLNYGGKNVVVVRIDATQVEGWFYEGAGIYRHVWLVKTAPVNIAPNGT